MAAQAKSAVGRKEAGMVVVNRKRVVFSLSFFFFFFVSCPCPPSFTIVLHYYICEGTSAHLYQRV